MTESGKDALKPEAHILVVDDDYEIRRLVAKLLRDDGYRVTTAANGEFLLQTIETASIDLVVLDVMLPGKNGLELCRQIRASNSTPVIMLTARGAALDRVLGLEYGADDYLAKPFHGRELLARVSAVLRRSRGVPAHGGGLNILEFEGWTIDTRKRELRDDAGVLIDLSGSEYDLLLIFAEAPQRVLSRDQLMDLTRNRIASGLDRTIDVQVSRLRRKLRVEHDGDGWIRTVRGAGYIFVPAVTRK